MGEIEWFSVVLTFEVIPIDFSCIGLGMTLEQLHARLHRHRGEVITFEFSFLGKLSLWVLIS